MVKIVETLQAEALLIKDTYRKNGFWYLFRRGFKYILQWPIYVCIVFYYRYLKYFGRHKPTFVFQGKKYNYFYHTYNATWKNERTIEVPIIWGVVQENAGARILEVGNVLRHYFSCSYDVVDLHERYPGIINADITNFCPAKKYDLIVSISTFEHIGCWEKEQNDPQQLLAAIENIQKNVLSPGGKLIITVPLGQNRELENFLASDKINFSQLSPFQQTSSRASEWKLVDWTELLGREFTPEGFWCGTNKVVVIGTILSRCR
jgi:hypothetical protein